MTDDYEPRPIGDAFAIRPAFAHAMAALRVALGPMWLGGLLATISDGCGGPPTSLPDFSAFKNDTQSMLALPSQVVSAVMASAPPSFDFPDSFAGVVLGIILAMVVGVLFVGSLLFALHCWIETGFTRLHVSILEHASDALPPLFSGRDRFWPMVGFVLLSALCSSAAFFVGAWPGLIMLGLGVWKHSSALMIGGGALAVLIALPATIYVGLGCFLGSHAVVLENRSPGQALRRSFALAHGNRVQLLLFATVSWLVQLVSYLGIVLCCVGILFTLPVARAFTAFAKTEAFLLFTKGHGVSRDWKLWHRDQPPPMLDAQPNLDTPP